ncbi:tetratricopeptide repeat protein [Nocardia sp. CA-128927]|uniref:tetratricopeptide repeat protein n=1 Tax=Nocardia sp. CA-128927 TaxID=3239975 RepID=UPI003D967815
MTDPLSESLPRALFMHALDLFEEEQLDLALGAATAALHECADPERASLAAECLHLIGLVHGRQDAFDAAVAAFVQAIDLLADSPLSEVAVESAEFAGLALVELDRAVDGMPYLRAAASGYGYFGEIEAKADCDHILAKILVDTGDFAAALGAFRAASDGYLRVDRRDDAAECRLHCAESAVELMKEPADAALIRDEFDAARGLFDAIGAELDSAHCSHMVGLACVDLEENVRAEAELRRARGAFVALDEAVSVAECDHELGKLLSDADRIDEAVVALTAASAEFTRHEQQPEQVDCQQRLADLHMRAARNHPRFGLTEAAIAEIMCARDACVSAGSLDLVAEIDMALGVVLDQVSRYPEAAAAHVRARAYYCQTDQPLEVVWCDANLATIRAAEGDYAGAERMLLAASSVFEDAADHVRFAKCQLYLANVAIQRSALDEALRLLGVAQEYAKQLDDLEFTAECCQVLGTALIQTGEHDAAIEQMDSARKIFEEIEEWAKVAVCYEQSGMAHFSMGRHAVAETMLSAARDGFAHTGVVRQMAGADMHLGLVYCETGRFDDAERSYERARGFFVELGFDADMALAEANLGGLYLKRDDYDAAVRAYRSAEETLRKIGLDHRAAVCRQNLAAATTLRGDYAGGAALLESARAYFESDPSFRRELAACYRNTAVTESVLGHYDSALTNLGRSRGIELEFGITIEVAKCDFWAATLAVAASDFQELRYALDLALPAMIFIDAQRFQFPQAASRIAWTELNARIQSQLFDWARQLGDASLMADLVEVAINSGTHVAADRPESSEQEQLSALASAMMSAVGALPDETVRPDVEVRGMGGAAALISGAALPMRPPPSLWMPDLHVALGPFIESSSERYGSADRPRMVPAW